jgi:predicted homoserine dehydrogenase-like protein
MNYQTLLARGDKRAIRVGLIGVGQFGMTLLAQSRRIADVSLCVLCDTRVEPVIAACEAQGFGKDALVNASSRAPALEALERGRIVITDDSALATSLPLDVIVEATGDAEAGARNAIGAIDNGSHLVLVTKETDSVVGPVLGRRARAAGLTLTQVDGDQPSLILALLSWARTLGLEIICAGKASEYDFVFDAAAGEIVADGVACPVSDPAHLWACPAPDLPALVAERARVLETLTQRSVPDFCELCLVANGSGLVPDRADLHAAVARTVELPDIYRLQESGGVLGAPGRLDVFNCLRRADEVSFAGGVFATVALPDRNTGRLFQEKGIPVGADHDTALIYNPTHLLGVEALMSVLVAARLGIATGSDDVRPVCDLAARARVDLPAGSVLSEGRRHAIEGVAPNLIAATPAASGSPIPYFMASGRRLTRAVAGGELIAFDAVEPAADSLLWRLRSEQDSSMLRA